jgi:hypothetical protein
MNLVAAIEALNLRAVSLRKQENIRGDGEKVGGYGLIQSNRVHPSPTENSRG